MSNAKKLKRHYLRYTMESLINGFLFPVVKSPQQGANSREPGGERRKERGERKEARDARDTTETRGKGREARDARHERRETQETQGEGPKARDARRETRRHERPKRSRGAKKTPKK